LKPRRKNHPLRLVWWALIQAFFLFPKPLVDNINICKVFFDYNKIIFTLNIDTYSYPFARFYILRFFFCFCINCSC
jgi:hypothetical protein